MKRLLPLLMPVGLLLVLSGCLEEKTTIETPTEEGRSHPTSLSFSDQEMDVLRQSLDISQHINLPVTQVPSHIGRFAGVSDVRTTGSDARKALLGRVLFYDTQLSATGETSCATCHKQEIAFSDDLAFSKGINGAVTKRNSIALGSVPTFAPAVSGYGSTGDEESRAVQGRVKFFWDERAGTVSEQSTATIQDEIEMGRDLVELSQDLRRQELYKILSFKAFGTEELTPERITLALEKFTSSITSMNTRFDDLANREFFESREQLEQRFTASELRGRELFNQNCASCHGANLAEPTVNVANNGLEMSYTDKGLGDLSGNEFEAGVFKVPFLRNVALTGPYMHDGRFATLREVIDHYSENIVEHPNLHHNLRNAFGNVRRLNLSEQDKQALIDFLEMATDETLATNESVSDPFRR
ncbi:cytochrome-c peroxidase [Lewinella sp. W8]|uniref:cytochrome-c peroxidase n=1 Tax=Lewinella sp. W8 TaxID=2528208 RepID=UPI001565098B|nr:cytochrome c peroxidase [Lewinella sp. W8]